LHKDTFFLQNKTNLTAFLTMAKLKTIISTLIILFSAPVFAQTLDTEALAKFSPSTQRDVFEVSGLVKLTPEQQVKLAKAIEKENAKFLNIVKDNEGILTVKGRNQLAKMRENTLSTLLSDDQLQQYYRGVFDKEADAEGNAIANGLQKKYNLTDQNWKFIRVACYKIALESRVIKKMMADQPKKAQKKIADLRAEWLKTIEEKGGIAINPDDMTLTYTREFNPNTLHK
jgi:hypothetical protein